MIYDPLTDSWATSEAVLPRPSRGSQVFENAGDVIALGEDACFRYRAGAWADDARAQVPANAESESIGRNFACTGTVLLG